MTIYPDSNFGRSGSGLKKRLFFLDILRGVAILLVLGRHPIIDPNAAGSAAWLAAAYIDFGWVGVNLFFVLSGFLVGGLLFDEFAKTRSIKEGRFLIRRGLKIWPGYFALVIYAILFARFRLHQTWPHILHEYWPNLAHVQNFIQTPLIPTWSLSVEEHFYTALVLLLGFLALRNRMRLIPSLALVILLVAWALRVLNTLYGGLGPAFATYFQLDTLFFGVLLGYVYHFHRNLIPTSGRARLLMVLAGGLLVSPMLRFKYEGVFVPVVGVILLYLGFGLILLAAVMTREESCPRPLLVPLQLLAVIGFYSYSIYLWHVILVAGPLESRVAPFLSRHLPPVLAWVAAITLYTAIASAAGIIMAVLIELPVLRLRDRIFKSTPTPEKKPSVVQGVAI